MSGWARSRQGEDRTPLILAPRRIYILPTRTGLITAVLLFAMLLAGLNYENNMALLLCFLLGGVVVVSIYDCHRMLTGLEISSAQVESAFAHGRGELLLGFQNAAAHARCSLRLRVSEVAPAHFELAPRSAQLVRARYQARERGRQRIDRLQLSSDAPLGMFRAWTWLHLPLEALVYPAPLRLRPLPQPQGLPRHSELERHVEGEEEWAWLRPFRDSDPLRGVAWKAYARGAPLMVAHYDAPAGARRILGLRSLRDLPLESALSQLADWVIECERRGESYALELPGRSVAAGHGLAQRRRCLEALALYEPAR
ncbi:MAG TPA: DUF58 domain-containing protein [Steroidobacteraceae bacterium]